jgi:hypothetical protein
LWIWFLAPPGQLPVLAREVMAAHGMLTISDLGAADVRPGHHPVDLPSPPAPPERLSLPMLPALCDIFNCTLPAELIATRQRVSDLGDANAAGIKTRGGCQPASGGCYVTPQCEHLVFGGAAS